MFPFDLPGNIRKPDGFLMFSGGSKGKIEKKRIKQEVLEHFRVFTKSLLSLWLEKRID